MPKADARQRRAGVKVSLRCWTELEEPLGLMVDGGVLLDIYRASRRTDLE